MEAESEAIYPHPRLFPSAVSTDYERAYFALLAFLFRIGSNDTETPSVNRGRSSQTGPQVPRCVRIHASQC